MPETEWEFYIDEAGEHRWRAKDMRNGKVLFVCAEGYRHKRDAETCAERAGWESLNGESPSRRC